MMENEDQDTGRGLAFALAAYVFWGFLPLYMKLLSHMSPLEVVAHRVIWSVPIAGALLIFLGRTAALREALRSPRMLAMACVTAALVSVNWAIYVYAIASGQALEAALGYYINPLVSVFFGTVFLGERMTRSQWLAIALAACAVGVLTYDAGRLPLVALGLTMSWGFYALCKKSLPIGPNQGFLLEVLILLPFALGFALWLGLRGEGLFAVTSRDTWLLLGCGVVTALPLLAYANGAKGLRLSTIGVLQYVAPTMIFLVAVFVFGETFGSARMVAFPMIWAAVVIFTFPMIKRMRAR